MCLIVWGVLQGDVSHCVMLFCREMCLIVWGVLQGDVFAVESADAEPGHRGSGHLPQRGGGVSRSVPARQTSRSAGWKDPEYNTRN